MAENTKKVKIVIVGNGFGGTYTVRNLHKIHKARGSRENIQISLIGDRDYFLFTPLLHEVATGGIKPRHITEPMVNVLRESCHNLHVGKVQFINLKDKEVEMIGEKDGMENVLQKIPFDFLVLAPGAETNFYNIPDAKKYCFPLKSLDDAIIIKNRLIDTLANAAQIQDRNIRKQMLRFVITGGGATGVELAAELHEFLTETFSHYYPKDVIEDVSIILIQKGPELLPQFGVKLRNKSLQVLQKKGIEVMLKTGVTEVSSSHIVLDSGKTIPTENVFWVAGVKPVILKFDQPIASLPDGRIEVNEYLQVPHHSEVFVLGDASAFKTKINESYAPGLAQVAVKESEAVAENIRLQIAGQDPKEFVYHHSGTLVSLGHAMAMGEIKHFAFWGRITWWIWRTVYLSKLISWKNKKNIAIEWTIALFRPRDISPL